MRLNQEQLDTVLERIRELNQECELCHGDAWQISDTVFEIREFFGGDMVAGSNVNIIPLITMTCNTCGNTKLLNALSLGVVTRTNQEGGQNG